MVCAYSVRAKQRPTVSTPVAWDEVREAVDSGDASALRFEMPDVLERVHDREDLFAPVLFAPVLDLRQDLATAHELPEVPSERAPVPAPKVHPLAVRDHQTRETHRLASNTWPSAGSPQTGPASFGFTTPTSMLGPAT
jgi:hypothetical protein